MNIKAMVDALLEQGAEDRKGYHVTLGELINKLAAADPDKTVRDQDGNYISASFISYRGYYSDLAIEPGDKSTVGEVLDAAKLALGERFSGYKGGVYLMEEGTPLWVADYGCCGPAIIGAADLEEGFILTTKEID